MTQDWKHGECNEICPHCGRKCVIGKDEVWVSHRCSKGHTW